MQARFSKLGMLVTLMPLSGGCGPAAPGPTEATVRMAVVADADHGGRPFHHRMTQEVTVQPPYAGDADGVGDALITVNPGRGEVCWELSVANVALPATAAHIHRAPAGVRGAIVVSLSAPDAAGTSTGCASELDRDLLEEMVVRPEGFYVNVHTTEYPAGAVRAQLGR